MSTKQTKATITAGLALVIASTAAISLGAEVRPGPARAQAPATTAFSKGVRVPANITYDTALSVDGQVLALIFDNLSVEVARPVKGQSGVFNQTAIDTKLFTVEVPYATDLRSVDMSIEIRGTCIVEQGGVVRLVACAGGATKVIDLSAKSGKKVALKGQAKAKLAGQKDASAYVDFQDTLDFNLPTSAAKPVCQISLFLVAEHTTDNPDAGSALILVDSIDVSIKNSGSAAIKP
jgi:hypothetical protein